MSVAKSGLTVWACVMKHPNKNTHLCIKNVNGSSHPTYSQSSLNESSHPTYSQSSSREGKSFMQCWRETTGSQRQTCSVLCRSDAARVGAHVQSCDKRKTHEWYLAPFCRGHNHSSIREPMYLNRSVQIVQLVQKKARK